MVNKSRIIEEFMELTKIDSETLDERLIADCLKQKLNDLGLQVQEDDTGEKIGGNAGNLIAYLPGKKEASVKLLFSAHMDTVKPGKNVIPIEEDGIIKTATDTILGADDKAGIAAILEMLKVIQEKNIEHGSIQIIFTVAEEGGLLGAKHLDPQLIDADVAYVLDSTGSAGHLVIQGPAQNQIEATIFGKAAHAGLAPEEGINAIQIAARGIARMKIGRIDEETTANIGVIKGGKATNIIPDQVQLEGEARSLNKEKLDNQCQHMVNCLERAVEELGGKVNAEIKPNYPEVSLNQEDKVIQFAVQAAQNLSYSVSYDRTGGGSDANILNGYGIPTANLGIGMEKVHTTDEFITVDNLVRNSQYLLEIVQVALKK